MTQRERSTYTPPPESQGVWEERSPRDAGWNPEALATLLDWCQQHGSGQLVSVQDGRIVAEQCTAGVDEATRYDVGSVQKCVVSFALGVLVARGELTLDEPAARWLGRGWTRLSPQDEDAIYLRHLASMTSGLLDDFSSEAPPGTGWYYNNNAYHQIRKAIEKVTGQRCQAVFEELLFERLAMESAEWIERPKMRDPQGWTLSGLHCTAREMARFGLLVLARGVWGGTPLLCDAAYFEAAFRSSSPTNPSYGLLWWLFSGRRAQVPGRPRDPLKSFGGIDVDHPLAPSAPRDTVAGMGAGDQRLYVVPSRNLVVVRHGIPAGRMSAAGGGFDEAFFQRLIPALPGPHPSAHPQT